MFLVFFFPALAYIGMIYLFSLQSIGPELFYCSAPHFYLLVGHVKTPPIRLLSGSSRLFVHCTFFFLISIIVIIFPYYYNLVFPKNLHLCVGKKTSWGILGTFTNIDVYPFMWSDMAQTIKSKGMDKIDKTINSLIFALHHLLTFESDIFLGARTVR